MVSCGNRGLYEKDNGLAWWLTLIISAEATQLWFEASSGKKCEI
jgi:hypothetical protein